ncbi:MAG: Plasmid stabilization system [Gammaproteobacteria bacterium]|jgi:proteic killer suppression protein|nr:Plasmid stabilization system [Gammaproteobacteria bacterium]MCE3238555.1 Plasmid stabilization system [Gammaproteobacteria bacterium]
MPVCVEITKNAKKNVAKLPLHIVLKLQGWVDAVKKIGVYEVRKTPGYHDEPLKGGRQGERSIRLNKGYRAIYVEDKRKDFHLISITEVNKHEY